MLCMLFTFLFSANAQENLIPAYPNLTFSQPMDIQAPPDGSDRLFIVEKRGVIRIVSLDSEASETATFLDIQERVYTGGDMGLQSIAFHPSFETNGYFFLHYTASNPQRAIISRFQLSSAGDGLADPESELELLSVNRDQNFHNGGQIHFGPDGFLYIPFGDGGPQGDPLGNSQNPGNFLGAMLRIDVDNTDPGRNYTIPTDNPFVGNLQGYLEEIFALGFRNPWRFSFGPMGKIWVGDVGQTGQEEISWVESGNNYGWNVTEGNLCYSPAVGCDTNGITPPVWTYGRSEGRSITGGYVYTNTNDGCSALHNKYLYADYVTQRVWAIDYDASTVLSNDIVIEDANISISSFARDRHGTVYLLDYGSFATLHKFACSLDPPLPVELTEFSITRNGNRVHLQWQTASELNNAGFEIQQKPADVEDFEAIAFVNGAGTTNEPQTYTFSTEALLSGSYIFRLKQVDFDGTFAYSDAIRTDITLDEAYQLSPIHPNPFNPSASFKLSVQRGQTVSIDVYDLAGRLITSLFDGFIGDNTTQQFIWEASNVPSGTYIIRVQGEHFVQNQRATLIK